MWKCKKCGSKEFLMLEETSLVLKLISMKTELKMRDKKECLTQ